LQDCLLGPGDRRTLILEPFAFSKKAGAHLVARHPLARCLRSDADSTRYAAASPYRNAHQGAICMTLSVTDSKGVVIGVRCGLERQST
jgi:hypothetical protein